MKKFKFDFNVFTAVRDTPFGKIRMLESAYESTNKLAALTMVSFNIFNNFFVGIVLAVILNYLTIRVFLTSPLIRLTCSVYPNYKKGFYQALFFCNLAGLMIRYVDLTYAFFVMMGAFLLLIRLSRYIGKCISKLSLFPEDADFAKFPEFVKQSESDKSEK